MMKKEFIEIIILCLLWPLSGGTIFLEVAMKNILIVDDEVQICEMMADLFESRGFNVSIAHSGNSGAKSFKESNFDLVVSDVRMPDGDGFSLARQISEIDPAFDKIVFITGFLDAESTDVPSNVRNFFKKPVRFKELLSFIEEILA